MSVDYTPTPTGRAVIQSEKKYTFVVGPVGSGKTIACIFKMLYQAKKQKPSPEDGIRYTRFVVVRNTNKELSDTTLKSFFQWFPPGVAGDWKATPKTFTFRYEDVKCEIMFRALDTPDDVSSVLSLEITGAMLDEFVEIPREIVDAIQSRCGRFPSKKEGGCDWRGVWGASNPGTQDSWWHDWLYEAWPDDEGGVAAQTKAMNFFEQPSGFSPDAENLENLPPYRGDSNEYYHELAVGKKPDWVKQYIEVQWGYSQRGKPVYKAFNKELHVAKQPLRFNPHLPLILGFDAGLTPAMTFMQQDSFGRVLILDELVSDGMGAQRFCREKVKPLLSRKYPNAVVLVAADPATNQRAQTDEKTVASVVAKELGVKVKGASSNDLAARLGAVDSFLTLLTEAGPALLIDPSCKTIINGFAAGYRFAINTKGVAGDKPDKNSYSHCFVGDTMVATRRGDTPICDVRVTDEVLTPAGYKPVLATMSADVPSTLRMEFSDGAVVQCTDDHPFVGESGTILARDLVHSDILFSISKENTSCHHAPNTPTSISRASGSTRSQPGILSLAQNTTCTVKGIYTALSGYITKALYQTVESYTTSTTISATIASGTSNCSPQRSIWHITPRSDMSVTLSPSYAGYKPRNSQRQRGTDPQQAESGIGSTGYLSPPSRKRRQGRACGASVSMSEPRYARSAGSVLCRAKGLLASLLGWMMWTKHARTVGARSGATSTTRQQHAIRLVRREIVSESARVYDLTVADEHVFYANGVLVGNCHDALQYGCMSFTDGAAREARARKHNQYAVPSRNTYVY